MPIPIWYLRPRGGIAAGGGRDAQSEISSVSQKNWVFEKLSASMRSERVQHLRKGQVVLEGMPASLAKV